MRHYCWLQHLQVFSSRTAETVSLSGAEGKLADGQTDWQRGNSAKPSPRSAVQTHALTKPCRRSNALPLVLWHITAHVTASPGRHMLHIQRICLDSALFPSSVFLALSHYIKLCTKPYPFPDLLILNAIFEIWSLLKAPRPMLLCSSASCLKKQSTGKLFLTADHNHPVS